MKSLFDRPIATQISRKPSRRTRGARRGRFNRILLPIDFSRPSLKAIPYALAIARQFGAEMHLLHVVDTTQYPPPTLLTLPLVSQAELNRRLMKQLQATAEKYGTWPGAIHVLKLREGRAYEEICEVARRLNADLIVIPTHGYTGYEHMFLGSTAERVVQHSRCPVLVVRVHGTHWDGATGCGPTKDSDGRRFLSLSISPTAQRLRSPMQLDLLATSERNCGSCM